MYRRYAVFLCALGGLAPQLAHAQALQIDANKSVAPVRKDIGDGICITAVHVADPALGQVPFSSVDDALSVLNKTQPARLTEDGRVSRAYSLINFRNNDPVATGDFPNDLLAPFSDNPGAAPQGNDRNYVFRVRGYINVDAADPGALKRTIGIYADDGARLRIGGALVTVPDIDERLNARRIRQVQYGGSGLYPVELIYYQNGSEGVLELSESNQWIPENTKLTNLADLGFTLIGEPRPNLFANTELYTSRLGGSGMCVECNDDSSCPGGNYCVKDWGPTPPAGLCQACNVAAHCGPSCLACGGQTPLCYSGGCVQCVEDSDCTGDMFCDQVAHSCKPVYHNWQYVGGCSVGTGRSDNGLGLPLIAALGLLLVALRRRQGRPFRVAKAGAVRSFLFLGAAFLFLSPGSARADLSANAQTFQPAIGPENIITVEGSRTGRRMRPILGVMLEYGHHPLRLIDGDTRDTLANTVTGMMTMHLMGGFGITRWMSLALDLPVVVWQGFDRATPIQDVPNEPSSYGIGDLRLVGKFRIINNERGGFGLAFVPQVTFATGDGSQFRGNDAYGIEPRFAIDYRSPGGAIIALNLGFLGRTSNQVTRGMEIGSQVRYGLGMYVPLPEGFGLMGEIAGGTSITSIPNGNLYSPLEGNVGGRWVHSSGINVNLGAGMAFTQAVGSPQFRIFAGIGYMPMEPKVVPKPHPTGQLLVEKSGSGTGTVSSTPTFIDCGQRCTADVRLGTQVVLHATPGPDSNFIGWAGPCSGTEDCVLTVRGPTRVGIEFAHIEEKRANVTIEKEGDGTGEVLSDPGGISCGKVCTQSFKVEQEVRFVAVPSEDSRFMGWEGACTGTAPCVVIIRGEPHLKAHFAKRKVVPTDTHLDLKGNVVHFETAKAKIDIDSFLLLDEVVLVLKEHPLMRLRIEGHTDAVPFHAPGGNMQLSHDRAAAVVQYLVEHGIEGARLSSEGYGDTCPVATNYDEDGRQANRRTEFLIVDKDNHYQRTPCVEWTPAPKNIKPIRRPGGPAKVGPKQNVPAKPAPKSPAQSPAQKSPAQQSPVQQAAP